MPPWENPCSVKWHKNCFETKHFHPSGRAAGSSFKLSSPMCNSVYLTFLQALNVMNVALEENRYSPIFQAMFQACSTGMESENLVVEVYGDDSDDVLDTFTIALKGPHFVLVSHGRVGDSAAWKVSEEYLHDVAQNPEKYVDHPSSLRLDWLKDRLRQWFHTHPARVNAVNGLATAQAFSEHPEAFTGICSGANCQ